MKQQSIICLAAVLTLSLFAVPALAQHQHEDLIVGRSDGGQLMIEFGHWDEAHLLSPVSGSLNGWLGDDPGFAHLEHDEPAENFYRLDDGAEIWFEVVSFEAAFQAWGPGFSGPYLNPGDDVFLGDDHLHEHLEWHINADDPGFDMLDAPWEATFKLVDRGTTAYADSPSYTLTFVPEPATAGLLLLGALVALRRRQA